MVINYKAAKKKKNPYLSLNIKTYKAAKIKTVSFFFFVKQELSLTN